MTKETFENRTKGTAKNSSGYRNALALLTTGEIQRTCHTSGMRRFRKYIDMTYETVLILKKAGLREPVDFVVCNDALRGGKLGNYIKLTTVGKRKMIDSPAKVPVSL